MILERSQDTKHSHSAFLLKDVTQKPHENNGHQYGGGQTEAHVNLQRC